MIYIVVTEVAPGGEHVRHYRFPLDPNANGRPLDYRARMSYNAFFNSVKKRNWKKDGTVFVGWREDDFLWDKSISRKFCIDHNIPTDHLDYTLIELGSIWEFYQKIGYDYKRKRYLC